MIQLVFCCLCLGIFQSAAFSVSTPPDAAAPTASGSSAVAGTSLYKIEGTIRLSRGSKPSTARVFLHNGPFSAVALVRADGTFAIHDVPTGTYVLESTVPDYVMPLVRIDISARDRGKVRATLMNPGGGGGSSAGGGGNRLSYPLVLRPISPANYFIPRPTYSITSMLKQPMVLMMGVTLLIVIVFPKLLANMDPAEMEEMKKMQGNVLGSLFKGIQGKTEDAGSAANPGTVTRKSRRP